MAGDRAVLLRNPHLGHRLDPESLARLRAQSGVGRDAVFVVADGLAPSAAESHALPVLRAAVPRLEASGWRVGPVVVAEQASVPLGDEIGAAVGAHLAVVLLGEPAGPEAAESLGICLTWDPAPGPHRRGAEPHRRRAARGRERRRGRRTGSIRLMTQARAHRRSGAALEGNSGAFDA